MWIGGALLGVLVIVGGWGAVRSFHSVDAGHVLVVRQFGEIVGQRGQAAAQRIRASALTLKNLQFEALQIFKENPPQIIFLPSGQGNLLDPSSLLRQAPSSP